MNKYLDKSFLIGWLLSSLAIVLIYPLIYIMQNHHTIPIKNFLLTIPFALVFSFSVGILIALLIGVDE